MLKHILSLLLGLTTVSYAQTIICTPGEVCTVAGNSTIKVIASKNVTALIVTCLTKDVCKKKNQDPGLIVYSSAPKSFVFCEAENSCEAISLNFGITPQGGFASEFEVTRDEVGVSCLGKQSCKSININSNGVITKGLNVKSSKENDASLMDAIIECGTSQCNVDCGYKSQLPSVCKNLKCYTDCNCAPIGPDSGCPSDINVRPTPQPTKSPTSKPVFVPTTKPTPSPVDHRNTTSCDVGTCIIEPEDNYDVDCSSSAAKCTITCVEENQCANGVIIQANSRQVELVCEGTNSCDKVKIFGVEANEITIVLESRKAAENMMIAIDNPKARLSIVANGDESFTNGQLFCDGNCNLECHGTDSCKSVLYECLSIADSCKCIGTQCPVIEFFGDQSCNNKKDCVVVPDGNTRVVALNNVDTLTIDCSQKADQCKRNGKGLKIFSAAKSTKVLCNNINTCEEVQLNVGNLKGGRVPKGFTEDEFVVDLKPATINQPAQIQTLEIDCNSESGCSKLNLYTTESVNTKILGDGEGALDRSLLICDNCESLEFECLDFVGCTGAQVLCPPVALGEVNKCLCKPIFVFVNETIEPTLSPRDTCPIISVYGGNRQSGIIASKINGNNIFNSNTKLFISISLVFIIFILIGAFILSKYKKSYTKINDPKNNEKMLVNENIYATQFQVEMH